MKRLVLMLAFVGAFAATQAQAVKKPNPEKSDRYNTSTSYTKSPAQADHTNVSVPEKVKSAFKETYADVKATWKKEGENFRAIFKSKDKEPLETIVVYDKDGKVLLTEREMKKDAGPAEIGKYCDAHYVGKNCKIWQVDARDRDRSYFVSRMGETIWFDKNGTKQTGKEKEPVKPHKKPSSYYK